jgi:hypothetical protein
MTFRYYAKEDPWQDDDDGNHGRPITLTRMGQGPGTEAIWNDVRGAWEPFPGLWGRLIGGDWWDRIHEERARRYFDTEAFDGGEIQEPLPDAEMDLLREAYRAHKQREAEAKATP